MSTYCGYGYYRRNCNDGLSRGARIGIGIAIAVGVIALCILGGILARRQRARRFAAQHQHAMSTVQTPMGQDGGGATGAYGGQTQASPYATTPSQGYVNYAPPPGVPPTSDANRAETGDAGFYAPPIGPPPPAYQPDGTGNKV